MGDSRFCLLLVLAVVLCLNPASAYDWQWKKGRATYYGADMRLPQFTATNPVKHSYKLTKTHCMQALTIGAFTRAHVATVPYGRMNHMGELQHACGCQLRISAGKVPAIP